LFFLLFFTHTCHLFVQSTKKNPFNIQPTGTDDEPHDYKFLSAWGPRFDKLVHLYGDTPDIEDDAIS
jgi:hypothetical protein